MIGISYGIFSNLQCRTTAKGERYTGECAAVLPAWTAPSDLFSHYDVTRILEADDRPADFPLEIIWFGRVMSFYVFTADSTISTYCRICDKTRNIPSADIKTRLKGNAPTTSHWYDPLTTPRCRLVHVSPCYSSTCLKATNLQSGIINLSGLVVLYAGKCYKRLQPPKHMKELFSLCR